MGSWRELFSLRGFSREGDWSLDEALRIDGVRARFEGHEFNFSVRDSRGSYLVSMVEHRHPDGSLCKFVPRDPVSASGRDIKKAVWESISTHNSRFHSLRSLNGGIEIPRSK